MIRYPSAQNLVDLNVAMAREQAGVRDMAGVEAVVGRPRPVFGEEVYPSLFDKAAALLHGIATTQCFANGNKRTAWAAAELMLGINGIRIRDLPVGTRKALVIATALKEMEIAEIATWLKQNIVIGEDRTQGAFLAIAAYPDRSSPGSIDLLAAFISEIRFQAYPVIVAVQFVTEIQWRTEDRYKSMPFTIGMRSLGADARLIGPTPRQLRKQGDGRLLAPAFDAYPDEMPLPYLATLMDVGRSEPDPPAGVPAIYRTSLSLHVPILVRAPGAIELVAELNGTHFATKTLRFGHARVPPGVQPVTVPTHLEQFMQTDWPDEKAK